MSPIMVKDFTWRQTEDSIIIRIPLHGRRYKNIDFVFGETYVKAAYQPYLFEVFLLHAVKDEENKCTIGECIIIELNKVQKVFWEKLEPELSKQEMLEIKLKTMEVNMKKLQDFRKQQQENKAELQRKAVREQIALDTKESNLIEEIKIRERTKSMKDFEQWRLSLGEDKVDPKSEKEDTPLLKPVKMRYSNEKQDIFNDIGDKLLPEIRKVQKIKFSFTPRAFPTPSRESKRPEEQEWLRKYVKSRVIPEKIPDDLRIFEVDPDWLQMKGESHFKAGNFKDALNIYDHAIDVGFDQVPEFYSNRAAVHIAMGNFQKAIEDTSKALDLLTPCVVSNEKSRLLCYIRRGTSLCKLKMYHKGLEDLEAALKLKPADEMLKSDVENIRKNIEKA